MLMIACGAGIIAVAAVGVLQHGTGPIAQASVAPA